MFHITILIRYREWLYHVSRGVDNDPVSIRTITKSIGCGKNFPGSQKLATAQKARVKLKENK